MLLHAATDNDIHPPLFGGPQRAFGLVRGLARRHDVRVLCLVPNTNRAAREECVDGVTLLRRKAWYTSAAWRIERAGLAPFFLVAHGHAANARRLARELPGPADALLADLPLAGLFEASRAPLKVHMSHNVEYDHFATSGVRVPGAARWRERLRALEARAVDRADLTVVCSDEDAARMRTLYGAEPARLHVAPNGYDETAVRPPGAAERAAARERLGVPAHAYAALFVGSDVEHNREAARFLLERVGPALAGRGVHLVIAGTVTRALDARREPWLTTVPETRDLAPVLHAADAGLNPVALGGGSNVKVPTYLAAGLAVHATPFGARGYPRLAPWIAVAEREVFAEALASRAPGWHARGETCPAPVADLAWGTIGERLGEVLVAMREGRHEAGGAGRRVRA